MKRFVACLLLVGAIWFVTISCKIGLGHSVDTETPKIKISNPPVGAVIRDSFAISGEWSDDGDIKANGLTVVLERTDGNLNPISFLGRFDEKTGTWKCIIDPKDSKNPIIDGEYQATVSIADTYEHVTTASTTFTIDNTPPVLVIKNFSDGLNDIKEEDILSFGQSIKLNGEASDDNHVKTFYMNVYADSNCQNLIHSIELLNVDTFENKVIASYDENDVNNQKDYNIIYNSPLVNADKNGTKTFYCTFTAYDDSQRYPVNSVQSEEDKIGNKTDFYYYRNLIEDNKDIQTLYSRDFYHVFNNTYTLSRSASSRITPDNIKIALEGTKVNVGIFSLNISNEPTYSITNWSPLEKDGEDFAQDKGDKSYNLTNGDSITINIKEGRDKNSIDDKSLKLYVSKCDENGNEKNEGERKEINLIPTKTGDGYQYQFTVNKKIDENFSLEFGETYLILVEGKDKGGKDIIPVGENGYGFYFCSSGGSPEITILEPTEDKFYVGKNETRTIKGYATVNDGVVSVTIKENDEDPIEKKYNEDDANLDLVEKKSSFEFEQGIEFKSSTSKKYEYTISASHDGNVTTSKRTIFYDIDKPEVTLSTIPGATDTKNSSYTFQGTVKDTGDICSGIEKVELTITDSKDKSKTWTESVTVGATDWSYVVKFTSENWKKVFEDEGKKIVTVKAIDKVGNESEIVKKDFIYDKENPSSTIEGIKDFIPVGGYEISGVAKDSYNLEKILIKQIFNEEILEREIPLNGKEDNWKYTLPILEEGKSVEDGKYSFDISVFDESGNEVSVKHIDNTVDTTPPTISMAKVPKLIEQENYKFLGSYDEKNLNGVYYKIGSVNDSVLGEKPSVIMPAGNILDDKSWIDAGWSKAENGIATWNFYQSFTEKGNSDSNNSELKEGEYKLFAYIVDGAGNFACAESDFKVDMAAPVVTETGSATYVTDKKVTLSGTVTETNRLVSFEIKRGKDVVKTFTIGNDKEIPESPSSKEWSFTDKTVTDDGEYEYVVTVKDAAGKTTTLTRKVIVDTTAPFVKLTSKFNDDKISETYSEFTGTFTEEVELQDVYYKFEETEISEPSVSELSEWSKAAKNKEKGNEITWNFYQKFKVKGDDGEGLKEGEYTLYIYAVDKAGNIGKIETFPKYKVDMAAPVVTETESETYVTDKERKVTLSGTVTETNRLKSFIITRDRKTVKEFTIGNGKEITECPSAAYWNFKDETVTEDGEYEYVVTVTDAAGKTTTLTRTVIVDTTAPEIGNVTVTNNSDERKVETENGTETWYVSKSINISVSPTDALSRVESVSYSIIPNEKRKSSDWTVLSNDGKGNFTGNIVFEKDGKDNVIYLRAKDNAGNVVGEDDSQKESFNIDTNNPVLKITSSIPTYMKKEGFKISGTAEDNITVSEKLKLIIKEEYKSTEANSEYKETEISKTGIVVPVINKQWVQEVPLKKENLKDGDYKYTFTLVDFVNHSISSSEYITTLDTKVPEIKPEKITTENTDADRKEVGGTEWYNTRTIKLSVVPENDATGIESVEYCIEGKDGKTNWKTLTNTNSNYKATIEFSDEGENKIYLKVKDNAGNVSGEDYSLSKTFYIDTVKPELEVITSIPRYMGNTGLILEGTATDASPSSGKVSVTIKEEHKATNGDYKETAVSGKAVEVNDGKWSQKLPLGKNTIPEEGLYRYTVIVTDPVNNKKEEVLNTLTVDTTAPSVKLTSKFEENIISETYPEFTGTFTEEVELQDVYYKFEKTEISEPSVSELSEWSKAVKNNEKGNGITWNFYQKFKINTGDGECLGEGEYTLYIYAVDKAGNIGKIETFPKYKVDMAAPVVTETGSATYVTDKKVTLGGTVTETNRLTSFIITRDGKPVKEFTIGNGKEITESPSVKEWNFTDETVTEDGEYEYVVTATDVAGKTTALTRKVTVDTVAPEMSIGNVVTPAPEQTENTSFKFTGSGVSDSGSGLDRVEIAFTSTNSEPSAKQITETPDKDGNWSTTVAFENYSEVFGKEGKKYIWVKAYDRAGNESKWTSKEFIYDTASPTLVTDAETPNEGSYVNEAEFSLKAEANDTWGISSVKAYYGEKDSQEVTLVEKDGKYVYTFVTGSENSGNDNYIADGKYTFTITTVDKAGKVTVETRTFTVDTTAPELNAEKITIENDASEKKLINGTEWYKTRTIKLKAEPESDTSGIASVAYSTDKNEWSELTNTGNGYRATVTFADDGEKTVYLKVTDNAGNESTEEITKKFSIDTTVPVLGVTTSIPKYMGSAGLTLEGTATDATPSSGKVSVTIKEEHKAEDGRYEATAESGKTVEVEDGKWSEKLPLGEKTLPEEGLYRYTVTVTDPAGNFTEKVLTEMTVDTTSPVITLKLPEEKVISETYPEVSGSAEETVGLKGVYYWLEAGEYSNGSYSYKGVNITKESELAGWKTATKDGTTGKIGWKFNESFKAKGADGNAYAEGGYKIYVYAADEAGNLSNKAEAEYYVDLSKPEVTETGSTTYVTDKKVTLGGTVTETNRLTSFIITRDGKTVKEFTIGNGKEITESPSAKEWNFTDETVTEDGEYEYVVTATDVAGKTTNLTRKVTVDTQVPLVDESKVVTPSSYETEGKLFKFVGNEGSVKDNEGGSGLDKVEIGFSSSSETTPANAIATVTPDEKGNWNTTVEFAKYTDIFGTQGNKYIWVRAYDKAGNASKWTSKEFIYDTEVPEISETTINSDVTYQNKTFTLSGIAKDSYKVKSVIITAKNENNDGKKEYTSADLGTVTLTGESDTEKTWLKMITLTENGQHLVVDGNYTFTIGVEDESGKKITTTRKVTIDTVKPTGTVSIVKPEEPITLNDKPFYNKDQVTLKVIPSDGANSSGISKVLFNTENNTNYSTWTEMDKRNGYYDYTISELAEGAHTYYFVIEDNAQNKSAETIATTFYTDTKAPESVQLVKATCDLVEYTTFTNSILVNNRNDIEFQLKVTDVSNEDKTKPTGVNKVILKKIGSTTPKKTKEATYNQDTEIWTLNVDKEDLSSGSLILEVTDNAGNKAEITTEAQFNADTTKPEISVMNVSSYVAKEGTKVPYTFSVNKNIKLSGKAVDSYLSSVDVCYWDEKGKEWVNVYHSTEADPTDWETPVINTENLNDESDYTFAVIAIDKAGNCNLDTGSGSDVVENHIISEGKVYPKYAKLDAYKNAKEYETSSIILHTNQDSDRPVITINNVELTDMSAQSYIGFQNSKIYGIISDDDGLSTTAGDIQYKIESTDSSLKQDWTNLAVSNGAFNIALKDGSQKILFKVKDSNGTEFTTTDSTVYTISSPIVTDETTKYGEKPASGTTTKATSLYITIDTTDPAVDNVEYRRDSEDWNTSITSALFGGTQNTFNLHQYAWDQNGIKSVIATIEKKEGDDSSLKDEDYTRTFVKGSSKEIGGKSFDEWKNKDDEPFNVKGMISGTRNLEIVVSDGLRERKTTVTISIDNTAPTLSFESHKNGEQVRSSFLIKGNISDGDTSTIVKILTTNSQEEPSEEDWENAESLKGSTAMTWRAYFDGDTAAYDEYSHFKNQKDLFIDLYGESKGIIKNKNGSIVKISNGEKYREILPVYFHLYVTDAVGNTGTDCFSLKIEPQGDIPTIMTLSPSADETIQSGYIRFSGTSDDDNAIAGLYIEIDPQYNGTTFIPWSDTHTSPNGKKVTDIYPTNDAHNPFEEIKSRVPEGKRPDTNAKAVYIGSSLSWNISLNKDGELNTVGTDAGNNKVAVRFYAVDVDGNISDATEPFVFEVDADSPKIGSSVPFYLKQYDNAGNETASMEYTDGMWLKGEWYLEGSAEDESGITSLTIKKNNEESVSIIGENATSVAQSWTSSSTSGYVTKYLIGDSKSGNYGQITYTLTATDGDNKTSTKTFTINYDNKAPTLEGRESAFYDISEKVQNSNGFYTIKSSVIEESGESGFERVVFYFKRTIDGHKNVYDTYLAKANTNNTKAYDSLIEEDYLYWSKSTVAADGISGSVVTLTDKNPNAHQGGIAKIGGVVYKINSVNGTNITLVGNPSADLAGKDIYFAIGNVVDHSGAESAGKVRETDTSKYGYGYYNDMKDDDGDRMIETVSTTGTRTIWSGSVNSQNIPDGQIEIHYVAFDKAGNIAHGVVENAKVQNNAPRLAGVSIWTDYNGNNSKDEGETESKYYVQRTRKINGTSVYKATDVTDELIVSGNDKDFGDGGSKFMNIRDKTTFTPELVGGNGDLYYTYKIGTADQFKSGKYPISGKGSETLGKGKDQGEEYFVEDDEGSNYIDSYATDKSISFNSFGTENNQISSNGLYWFEYTIFDSTEGCVVWNENNYTDGRLSATMRIALNVDYFDNIAPWAKIKPFYWNSSSDNSLYKNSREYGHIELPEDLPESFSDEDDTFGNDPKVSGIITLKGYAYDNIRLKSIKGSFWAENGVLGDGGTNNASTTLGVYSSGKWSSVSSETDENINKNGWTFSATDIFMNENGHLAEWKLNIDTSKISNSVGLDKYFDIYVEDERGPVHDPVFGTITQKNVQHKWSEVKNDNSKIYYMEEYGLTRATVGLEGLTDNTIVYEVNYGSEYQFDIVPYITEVRTNLSSLGENASVYNRTALGHYPVNGGNPSNANSDNQAEKITLTGFNLGSPTVQIEVPNNSGKLTYSVNDISIINNMNNNDAKGSVKEKLSMNNYKDYAYNRVPNGVNNDYLTDDVIFDVWEINTKAAQPISGLLKQPVMSINQADKNVGLAFVNGPTYFSMGGKVANNTYSYDYWIGGIEAWTSVGFTYDSQGYSYAVAAGGDFGNDPTKPYGASADKFRLFTDRWGRAQITSRGYYGAWNSVRFDSIGQVNARSTNKNNDRTGGDAIEIDKERFQSSSIVTSVNDNKSTNVYLAYYDLLNDQIRFRWGTYNGNNRTNDTVNTSTSDVVNLKNAVESGLFKDEYGDGNKYDKNKLLRNYSLSSSSLIAGRTRYGGDDTGYEAGPYVSIAVVPKNVANTTDDVIVAVWYDDSADLMYYAYNESPKSIKANTYTPKDTGWVVKGTDIFGSGVGEYCKVVTDAKGGIHIAAYDSTNSAVKYAYLGNYLSYGSQKVCTVDSYGTAIGEEISIDVGLDANENPVPYISYYGNKKPMIAYYVGKTSINSLTADANFDGAKEDKYTTNWEVSIIPTSSKVSKDHVNVGLWKNNGTITDSKVNKNVANCSITDGVGFSSIGNNGVIYGNGTSNPILGYATSPNSTTGYFETAQKK